MNQELFGTIGYNAGFVLAALLLTFLAKKADDWRTSSMNDDEEIIEKKNLAVGLRRAGLYLGGLIAMAGVLAGPTKGFEEDILGVLIFGALGYVLLFAARFLFARLALLGIPAEQEIARGNIAVGSVEFGVFVATGILINGAVSGEGEGWAAILSTLIFFVLGEGMLILVALIYQKITPYPDKEELRRGNAAVGVMLAGMPIALSLILRASLLGPTTDSGTALLHFLVSSALGILLLFVLYFLVRFVFLCRATLTKAIPEQNLAVAFTMQALLLAFAYLIASAVV